MNRQLEKFTNSVLYTYFRGTDLVPVSVPAGVMAHHLPDRGARREELRQGFLLPRHLPILHHDYLTRQVAI